MATTAYMIVSAPTPAALADVVRSMIPGGWQPHAGVIDGGNSLYQALVTLNPLPANPYVTYDVRASTTPSGLATQVVAYTNSVQGAELLGTPLHTSGLFLQAVAAPSGSTAGGSD